MASSMGDEFDPSKLEIAGHDFTETPLQREMRLYQEANGNATGPANKGLQSMKGPDGTIWQRMTHPDGQVTYKSPYVNGKAAVMYKDADGQWKPQVIKEESGGLIKGVWDTVTTDEQFMGFLAVAAGSMAAAYATGSTSVASLAGEGAAGGAGEIAAVSGAAPAGAAPASGGGAPGEIPPATDYGAPQNMVGGEAGSGGLGATPSGGAPIQNGPTNGVSPGSTVQNNPGLIDSAGNLAKAGAGSLSGLTDAGGFWGKLLLSGVSGAMDAYSKERDREAQAERDKLKHERDVAENIRQEQWKVRNMNVENMPKLNWAPFAATAKPELPKPPKPTKVTIGADGMMQRVEDEE